MTTTLKTLTAAAALAAAMLTFHPASSEARWYIWHMGPENCVPVDDIGDNLERLYYGTGAMKTPEDFMREFAKVGGHTVRRDISEGVVAYDSTDQDLAFVFFQDKALGQAQMAKLDNLK
jgi:hypothetical protein